MFRARLGGDQGENSLVAIFSFAPVAPRFRGKRRWAKTSPYLPGSAPSSVSGEEVVSVSSEEGGDCGAVSAR